MSERLDDMVARLAAAATDHPLDGMEAEIGRDIRRRRGEVRAVAALTPVRVASVGLALAAGLTTGGATAAFAITTPQPFGTFSSVAHLAPSTLLEGGE